MLRMQITEWLRKKSRNGARLRGSGLAERLARDLGCGRADVLRCFPELRSEGVLSCADWSLNEPLGMVTVHLPELPSVALEAWRRALKQAALAPHDASALDALGAELDGFPPADMPLLLQGLLRLRREQQGLDGVPRFEVSARYLLDSSKALDVLPSAPLRRFGIDVARFPPFPGYVMVAGPAAPSAVILVENPQPFERALEAEGCAGAAWICTFGYGLSLRRSRHGEQLAALLESRMPPRTLTRKGDPPGWETLLRHERILFWGDLDLEGLAICQRLQRYNPRIALSGIYDPMVDHLRAGGGHPYCGLVGKAGQSAAVYGGDLEPLLALCRQRALDQEWVTEPMISRYWNERLVI